MEGSQLLSVKKFVKQTLNLSDGAKVSDFSLQITGGVLKVEAKISMEVNYEELTSLADGTKPLKRAYVSKVKSNTPPSRMPMVKGAFTASRSFEATASDFHCIKVILRGWRKIGKLTENELDVIAGYGGKFFTSMTQEEKDTFLKFFYAVRLRLDQKKQLA